MAPVVKVQKQDEYVVEVTPFGFSLPYLAFEDTDGTAATLALTFTAYLENGDPLPSWLVFDASNFTFSGTPPDTAAGILNVVVKATSPAGLSATDVFKLDIANREVGTNGADIMPGSNWRDVLFGGDGDDVINGGNSQDVLYGEAGNDTLDGGEDGDTLDGGSGDDILNGGLGNDVLLGGEGIDTLSGGAGSDRYVINDLDDILIEHLDEGDDIVESSLDYTLSENFERLELAGGGNINATGNSGMNVLIGNSGNNVLDGDLGADELRGGEGDDSYIVENAADTVIESSNAGNDSVYASVSYTIGNHVEGLYLTGDDDIHGTGNGLANTIIGNSGNNTLNGLIGADTLQGGLGDDLYVVDNIADVVHENYDEGVDTIYSSVSYTLAENVENLTLAVGVGSINATGNALNNLLIGTAGSNVLSGVDGDDTLDGGDGNDTLYGGTGSDLLLGGNGSDTLDGGEGIDQLNGGAGNDTYIVTGDEDVVIELVGGGTDIVLTSGSHTLLENVENLTLTGTGNISGTGNAMSNTILGNNGNNVLDGGAGGDNLRGGLGNDIYIVDSSSDVIYESSNSGVDTVLANFSLTLLNYFENLTLLGTDNINATGNTMANVLTGNSGNNVLDGMAGIDQMIGGAGDDVYAADNQNDVIVELANEGIDTVVAYVNNYVMTAANVENLSIRAGLYNWTATGNDLDNVITGNQGDNVLYGLGGNDWLDGGIEADDDVMYGGTGDDTYIVDHVDAKTYEYVGEGTDSVRSYVSYSLMANVENLTLLGTAALNGIGNESNNILIGNGGANSLSGGLGNDVLDGGFGGDVLNGGAGNDTYVLGHGYGSDSITDSDAVVGNSDAVNFLTGISVDQLWFRHVSNTNNLEVSVIGTSDKFTIQNWYSGSANHIEQFRTADGKVLLDTQVENLVQAMASFAPPAAGQTTLPQNYQDQLGTVIAASWQ